MISYKLHGIAFKREWWITMILTYHNATKYMLTIDPLTSVDFGCSI